MQQVAPEAMNLKEESPETLAAYGADPNKDLFANNCLLARVWSNVACGSFSCLIGVGILTDRTKLSRCTTVSKPMQSRETDQPIAAMIET